MGLGSSGCHGRHGCAIVFFDLRDQKRVVLKVNTDYDEVNIYDPDAGLFPKNGMDWLFDNGLRHPSILRIEGLYSTTSLPGHGWSSGLKGFFGEWCQGGDLMDLSALVVEREVEELNGWEMGAVTEKILMPLIGDILSGLKWLHDRGLAHSDLIPENVCIKRGEDGRARAVLIDIDHLQAFRPTPDGHRDVSKRERIKAGSVGRVLVQCIAPIGDFLFVGAFINGFLSDKPDYSAEARKLSAFLYSAGVGGARTIDEVLALYQEWVRVRGPGVRFLMPPPPPLPERLLASYRRGDSVSAAATEETNASDLTNLKRKGTAECRRVDKTPVRTSVSPAQHPVSILCQSPLCPPPTSQCGGIRPQWTTQQYFIPLAGLGPRRKCLRSDGRWVMERETLSRDGQWRRGKWLWVYPEIAKEKGLPGPWVPVVTA
mmetsp:Transcript_6637/g.19228  ORF Transcript_6637/g.19228 Transcript_6637/m.19228 type:complete len:429 (-) Transcript_6637:1221-2507(-)